MGFPLADGTIQRSDMFIPLVQGPNTLSYLNLRNELNDEGFAGFSTGVGLRHRMNHFIVGLHGFIDWRETDHSEDYRQFSAGAELLGEHWELRWELHSVLHWERRLELHWELRWGLHWAMQKDLHWEQRLG